MAKEIILTLKGMEELKLELKHLLDDVRPKVIEELVDARNQGDLSENADYDAARNRQAEVEARIKELENMINKAQVIEDTPKSTGIIKIGSTVKIQMINAKKEITVKIVGIVEADPFKGLISNESPIAKAILHKKVGEIVEVKDVNAPYTIKVLKVN